MQNDAYPETTATPESAEPPAPETPVPQPKKRKFLRLIIIGLIVILLLAGAFFTYLMFFWDMPVQFTAAPAQKITDYEVVPETALQPQSEFAAPDNMKTIPIGETEVHDSFASETEANAAILEDIEKTLDDLHSQNAQLAEQINKLLDLRATVLSLINMQSVVAESLEDRLQAIEDNMSMLSPQEVQSQRTSVTEPPDLSKPPFQLIGIDRWNNEWNAVVLFGNKMTMLGQDETRAEWTLSEIDAANRQAHFVHATGDTAILTVE